MINPPTAPLTTPARDALISELRRHVDAVMNAMPFDLRRAHDHAVLGFLTAIRLMADERVRDSYVKYCKAGASRLSRLIKENTGIDFTFTCDSMADLEAANETYLKWVFRKPRVAVYFAMIMLEAFINAAYGVREEETAPRESGRA
jgi:hypothetical protein